MATCPRECGENLLMAERRGVSIDYCPKCRGIWLDHGELEKILEMELKSQPAAMRQEIDPLMPPPGSHPRGSYRHDDRAEPEYVDYKYGSKRGRRRKRGGLLGEVFDIFD